MNRSKKVQELPTLLDDILEKYQLKQKVRENQIISNWEKIVGTKLAQKCTAIEFSDGVLTVKAENETWRQELALRQSDLLNLVNGENDTSFVKKIKIV